MFKKKQIEKLKNIIEGHIMTIIDIDIDFSFNITGILNMITGCVKECQVHFKFDTPPVTMCDRYFIRFDIPMCDNGDIDYDAFTLDVINHLDRLNHYWHKQIDSVKGN